MATKEKQHAVEATPAPNPRGLVVQFSPSRFSESDLGFIFDLFSGTCGKRSPKLAGWLFDVLAAENLRRISLIRGEPKEIELPLIDFTTWSGADHADALLAAHVAQACASERPIAREFFERVQTVFIVMAGRRLTSPNH